MGIAHHVLEAKELAGVVASLREGIQIIDREWRYAYLNTAAAAHGRVNATELLGRTMSECYPGIEGTELLATLQRCMDSNEDGSMRNKFA